MAVTNEQFYEMVINKYEARRKKRIQRQKMIVVSLTSTLLMAVAGVSLWLFTENGGETPPAVIPPTTTTQPIGIGGDSPYPRNPFAERFWPDTAFEADKAMGYEAYMAWTAQFYYSGGERPIEEWNVYNLIHENGIPRETVERLCAEVRDFREPDDAAVMSEADIERIYTATKAEAYQHMVAIYAVAVEEKVYSAAWLATHTADEYLAAGMTVEQVTRAHAGLCSVGEDVLQRREIEYVEQQLYEMIERVQ